MASTTRVRETVSIVQVPEYFYAVDIDYLTHMIGKLFEFENA